MRLKNLIFSIILGCAFTHSATAAMKPYVIALLAEDKIGKDRALLTTYIMPISGNMAKLDEANFCGTLFMSASINQSKAKTYHQKMLETDLMKSIDRMQAVTKMDVSVVEKKQFQTATNLAIQHIKAKLSTLEADLYEYIYTCTGARSDNELMKLLEFKG